MFRKSSLFVGTLVAGAIMTPTAALADDPRDPSMRSAAARARDSAIIKRMNQEQLAMVRERDGRSMAAFRQRRSDLDSAYADARADYARQMAAWRHAVSACRSGQWDYCAR